MHIIRLHKRFILLTKQRQLSGILLPGFLAISFFTKAQQSGNAQALADKLSNPVASMISVPFQNNTDWGIGPNNGSKNTLNFQPVIPFKLSSSLNFITRCIVPIISQKDITGPGTSQVGISDATVSGFFSPVNSKRGFIWGAGPVLLIPTATNKYLGTKKFGIGPTVLVLKQVHGNTVGFLANQLWSVAGDKDRQDISQLFFQPFFSHSFSSGAALGANMEITQNWKTSTTIAFLTPTISGITTIGKQPVQMAIGPRIPISGPDASRPAFGVRAVLIFVFTQ